MTIKIILGAIVAIAFLGGTIATGTMASAQTAQSNVPEWVKNNAGWWADGSIPESDFFQGIQWLIDEEIIQVATAEKIVTQTEFQSMVDRINGLAQNQNEIADMIKQNTGALDAQIVALQAEVDSLKLLTASMSADANNVYFTGVNVNVRDGTGSTECGGACNSLGNLIVGYDESHPNGSDKSGSHNFVVGELHNYQSYSGFVAGYRNTVSGPASSVSGGWGNTASGQYSSVSGGLGNTASGQSSYVSGGGDNTAEGPRSTVSGGLDNTAEGPRSTVSGGWNNTASGEYSSVSGGWKNTAEGLSSTVSGGGGNTAEGLRSAVSGGWKNTASGEYSSVSGGGDNTAEGPRSTVSGGGGNTASGEFSSVSGGFERTAAAFYDWVAGTLFKNS
jgi:hypothetical protein